MILENPHNEMLDLFNFASKCDDAITRPRDISNNRPQTFVCHMIDYAHAKFQGSRMRRTEITEGGGANEPPSLPVA